VDTAHQVQMHYSYVHVRKTLKVSKIWGFHRDDSGHGLLLRHSVMTW